MPLLFVPSANAAVRRSDEALTEAVKHALGAQTNAMTFSSHDVVRGERVTRRYAALPSGAPLEDWCTRKNARLDGDIRGLEVDCEGWTALRRGGRVERVLESAREAFGALGWLTVSTGVVVRPQDASSGQLRIRKDGEPLSPEGARAALGQRGLLLRPDQDPGFDVWDARGRRAVRIWPWMTEGMDPKGLSVETARRKWRHVALEAIAAERRDTASYLRNHAREMEENPAELHEKEAGLKRSAALEATLRAAELSAYATA